MEAKINGNEHFQDIAASHTIRSQQVRLAAMAHHVRLAQSLPPRLLHFFKRYPPPALSAASSTSTPSQTIQIAENTSSSDPNAPTSSIEVDSDILDTYGSNDGLKRNPFLPFRNPRTGNWHPPHYSLRRQADLFKLASSNGVLPLMPVSPKHPEIKEQKRIENGLRVQGTGIGKKVKGKMWERTLKGRLEERRKAMEGMPELIRQWEERGHGRGWKKWPK